MRHGWGRMPSLPRGRRCRRGQGICLTAACRLTTAGPCHPGVTTRPGMSSITGHQQGFTGVHPSQPSPHLWPPDGTAALGLSPGLRTPPGRTRRRTPGRGRASALPEVTSSASLTSSDALTHRERHHVAQPLEIRLGPFLVELAQVRVKVCKATPAAHGLAGGRCRGCVRGGRCRRYRRGSGRARSLACRGRWRRAWGPGR